MQNWNTTIQTEAQPFMQTEAQLFMQTEAQLFMQTETQLFMQTETQLFMQTETRLLIILCAIGWVFASAWKAAHWNPGGTTWSWSFSHKLILQDN